MHVWRAAVAVALAGFLITTSIAIWLWNAAEEEETAELAVQGQELADGVGAAVDEVVERLVSVGSFYQGSEEVTLTEFRRFIANFTPIAGMGGIGYMPIVRAEDLDDFEANVAETIPGYQVFEFDEEGNRVPVGLRSSYVPVQWFEPADAFGRPHGFDSASEEERRLALNRARSEKEPAVTTFISLVSEEDPDGFLIYWPVADPNNGQVAGYTVAPMDLSELMDGQVGPAMARTLHWEIEVLTSGRRPALPRPDTWSTVIDMGSNWWSLTVTKAGGAELGPAGSDVVFALVIAAGVMASVVGAAGVYLHRRKKETQKELDRLRELARAKDQFLASVSHELRTPLTGVLGFAELLRDSDEVDLTDEDRRTMIANVAEEATDLAAIIDDLLVAARSELDLLAITRVPVSFRAQTAQIVETAQDSMRDRIEIVAEPEVTYTAIGDPGRVRQIIRNLITNAGRYGGERVQIRFDSDGSSVSLEVADNGAGIPPQEWEQIFEPYYRAHQSNGTQPAALGIGLSVARHLARLMDGDLAYSREAGWSVFRLTLPVAPSKARRSEAVTASHS